MTTMPRADVAACNKDAIIVLGRRHLQAYLYDDEVLTAKRIAIATAGVPG